MTVWLMQSLVNKGWHLRSREDGDEGHRHVCNVFEIIEMGREDGDGGIGMEISFNCE